MIKSKACGTLALGVLAFFMLGGYVIMEIENVREVPIYKFILNAIFGVFFLNEGLKKIKKL